MTKVRPNLVREIGEKTLRNRRAELVLVKQEERQAFERLKRSDGAVEILVVLQGDVFQIGELRESEGHRPFKLIVAEVEQSQAAPISKPRGKRALQVVVPEQHGYHIG